MSQQGWDKDEGHARKPGRSTSSGDQSGGGGGGGPIRNGVCSPDQALPAEHKAAPSTPVQQDLKQQPFPRRPNEFAGYDLKNAGGVTFAEAYEELKLDKRMGISPVAPMQVMHKAKKKYVAGKFCEQEEVKQRQLNAILNKLTARNLDKLLKEVVDVNIDNVSTLSWFVSQIFYRVLTEPTFCRTSAIFCSQLVWRLPEFGEEYNRRITFRRLLLNKCQDEFERCERKEAEAGKTEEELGIYQTKEEREESRIGARRRMLGNIRFIGELQRKRMLTENIMHGCIKKLFGNYSDPDEENIEGLCVLISTIGEMIDHPKSKERMDDYFGIMEKLSRSQKLCFRVRFLLMDLLDLRKNKWQQVKSLVKGESRA